MVDFTETQGDIANQLDDPKAIGLEGVATVFRRYGIEDKDGFLDLVVTDPVRASKIVDDVYEQVPKGETYALIDWGNVGAVLHEDIGKYLVEGENHEDAVAHYGRAKVYCMETAELIKDGDKGGYKAMLMRAYDMADRSAEINDELSTGSSGEDRVVRISKLVSDRMDAGEIAVEASKATEDAEESQGIRELGIGQFRVAGEKLDLLRRRKKGDKMEVASLASSFTEKLHVLDDPELEGGLQPRPQRQRRPRFRLRGDS